jgi:hypothetical protein
MKKFYAQLESQVKALSRKPSFWVSQVLFFVICVVLSLHYYPKAFPIVDLEIKLTRKEALERAKNLAGSHKWAPLTFKQTASFSLDQMTQTFVELSAGGNNAFKNLLQERLYFPYTWDVRNFAEGQTSESHVFFTPEGNFYGFYEKIPEDQAGAALSFDSARKIAETAFQKDWALDLSPFKLVENSQERKPGNRVDHVLVYERTAKRLGEGRYRLKLTVSGDRLTEINYFIKIPESFARKYSEMRSFNNTISSVATVLMVVLYLIGGCIVGLFFLGRIRWVIWKMPIICGIFVSALQSLEKINQLPLMWMSYDTAVGTHEFLLRFASNIAVMFVLDGLLLSVSFMAAESLTRRAFPQQPQLWRTWTAGNANSVGILGRTLGGYLSVGFFFSFVVFAYLFGSRYLHWWTPSDALYQPDSLASYFPWFTSIAHSLHAGFWEECLFRAVPLAGAALLGTRFGNRKKWIFGAFLLQALIFAAAHANYPAQPSYARVVELILPSCLFGGFYLLFGLLPGIILHFTFDVVSFAIPIFSAKVPGIWVDQLLVVLLTLTPLWISLFFRLKQGKWVELKASELNRSWSPPHLSASEKKNLEESISHRQPHLSVVLGTGVTGIVALLIWVFGFHYKSDVAVLETKRAEAVHLAEKELSAKGVNLSLGWEPLSSVYSQISLEDRFLWKNETPETYRRIAHDFLIPPTWVIRFVRFNTDVVERAEEYLVLVGERGKILRTRHELPEGREGATLSQEAARELVLNEIRTREGSAFSNFKELSNSSSKLPKRTDWQFIFSDTSRKLKMGDARLAVGIAGDQTVAYRKFIFTPEDWLRTERARENLVDIVKMMSNLLLVSILIGAAIVALMNWSKKKFDRKTYMTAFLGLSLLESINFLNNLPVRFAHFLTAEPKFNQIANTFLFGSVKILVASAGMALLIGYIHYRSKQSKPYSLPLSALMGYGWGLIGALAILFLAKISPADLPTWGNLNGFDSFLPILKPLQSVNYYLMLTVLFLVVANFINQLTRHWTQRKLLGSLCLFIFSAMICGLLASTLQNWGMASVILASFLILAFRFAFNSHLSLIPLATASILVTHSWMHIQIRPYVGSIIHDLLSAIVVLGLSWVWFQTLRRIRK